MNFKTAGYRLSIYGAVRHDTVITRRAVTANRLHWCPAHTAVDCGTGGTESNSNPASNINISQYVTCMRHQTLSYVSPYRSSQSPKLTTQRRSILQHYRSIAILMTILLLVTCIFHLYSLATFASDTFNLLTYAMCRRLFNDVSSNPLSQFARDEETFLSLTV